MPGLYVLLQMCKHLVEVLFALLVLTYRQAIEIFFNTALASIVTLCGLVLFPADAVIQMAFQNAQ